MFFKYLLSRRDSLALISTAIIVRLVVAATAAASTPSANGLLAFSSNRSGEQEIYLANADGTGRTALGAQGDSPQWSPAGNRIAFSSNRDGNNEIYVMNADGSGQTRLTFDTDYESRPQWTADGSQLVYTRVVNGNWEIFRMNADGSNQVDLTNDPAVDWGQATSPQGKLVVFTREENSVGHLFVMTTDGKAVRRLTNTSAYDSYPSWSPSGNLILFTRDPGELWLMASDGTGAHQVTNVGPSRVVLSGSWSPDGMKIIYTTCATATRDNCTLHTANADGSAEAVVTKTFGAPFVDDFSSTPLGDFWSTSIVGAGTSVRQTNGQLQISLPAGGLPDPSSGFANPGVFSVCNLRGDFDIQVDYDLLTQPFPDSVNPLFNEGNFINGQFISSNGIFLSKFGISGNFDGVPFGGFVPNVPPRGSMRLTRQGSTLTASYDVDGTWQTLETRDDLVADESDVALSLFSNAIQQVSDVNVAFDNFRVNSGTFACPTWWSDNNADWQPIAGHDG